ncbi:hypothetical protein [Mucilaginibacter lappiensis]|uniref:Uncharacterized protein n=1 Tax=Mucilaginibacter lappiensis TaxID=354630 RepID=A0A1N6UU30_9SPHI|nr:hypothetical protein [Mucilaginibacter lappiensis]MBB6108949.1 hypothetical protein [Mucilaginibacter lappiensis]MBB6130542.1 hypothetical protein [Mucilaginibacter lappiensis]SIQ68962.1 hypothetical protein SAMN05421821_103182 [Mucilaginibacter lappiensis]
MTLVEFLKWLKRESEDIERLNVRNYYIHLEQLFKIIAYDGARLDKKHSLMITTYLQYMANTKRDEFRNDLSKTDLGEILESVKTDLDCMIFRIEQGNKPLI